MENNKILDLSELSDEVVNDIKSSIDFMKEHADVPGKIDFIADTEKQGGIYLLNRSLNTAYLSGISDAVLGGSIGLLAVLGYGYFRYKTKKWIK